MIEPGTYTGTLRGVTFGKSKNTGTPCLASEWYIEEEETIRTVYTYLSKKAKKISFKKLSIMGFNGDFENPDFSVETTELNCSLNEYVDSDGNDKENEKWDFANWGSAGVDEADRKTVKQMNAEWKKANGSSAPVPAKSVTTKKTTKPEPEQEVEETDEPEIPDEPDEPEEESDLSPYEQAWDAFIENKATPKAVKGLQTNKRQTALKEWAAVLEESVPEKDEEDFDDEDWEAVRLYAVTPF